MHRLYGNVANVEKKCIVAKVPAIIVNIQDVVVVKD